MKENERNKLKRSDRNEKVEDRLINVQGGRRELR